MRLLEETLQAMKVKLGTDDPNTLKCMNFLALADIHDGKLNLAVPLYEETLAKQKAKLGMTIQTHSRPCTISRLRTNRLGSSTSPCRYSKRRSKLARRSSALPIQTHSRP